jgi:hypothetical protein
MSKSIIVNNIIINKNNNNNNNMAWFVSAEKAFFKHLLTCHIYNPPASSLFGKCDGRFPVWLLKLGLPRARDAKWLYSPAAVSIVIYRCTTSNKHSSGAGGTITRLVARI